MRKEIASKLHYEMSKDENVFVLFGDLGNNVLDKIREDYPNRAINCGIAEQNMVSVAAGLAINGKRPVVYSIAPFIVSRAYEQIKIDICQQNLGVILLGVGAGLSYGKLGPTHHCLEDIPALSCLPNMKICCPYDRYSAMMQFGDELSELKSPVYFRLGRDNIDCEILAQRTRSKGRKVGIFVVGSMLNQLREVVDLDVDFVPVTEIYEGMKIDYYQYNKIVVVEESYRGGFSSVLLERLASDKEKREVKIINCKSDFVSHAGTYKELLRDFGLDKSSLADQIQDFVKR